ncbi:MAG: hypothetical protein U0790_02110 [Isosphaeraceae bacterium]
MDESPKTKTPAALEPPPHELASATEELRWYAWEAEITDRVDGKPRDGERRRLRTITVIEHWGDAHYEPEIARLLDDEDADETTGTEDDSE